MESKRKQLEDIKAKMQEAANNGDNESAHCDADDLLCQVIKALSTKDTKEIIDAILTSYNAVGKWYA